MIIRSALILLSCFVLSVDTSAAESILTLEGGGSTPGEYSLARLSAHSERQDIQIYDPIHKKRKHYSAVPFQALIQETFGDDVLEQGWTSIAFVAEDGYEPIADISVFAAGGAFIVFEDLDDADWESIAGYGVKPGPFYMVWTGPDQEPKNGYPWPWQLTTIRLTKFDKDYSEVIPADLSDGSAVSQGYDIFRKRCISCHAINRQGGSIGPDLGAPRSITDYRSDDILKKFIRDPSKFRYGRMPDFTDLSDQELDQLIVYFRAVGAGSKH